MAYGTQDTPYPTPGSFWGGGQPSIVPNTAPTVDFQGTTEKAVPGQPGTYSPTGTNAPDSGNGKLWMQTGQNPQAFVQALIARDKLVGTQTDPASINKILAALKEVGVNASLDTRTDQYHKGIMLNGQFVKLLDGSNNWMWGAGGEGSGGSGVDTSGLLNSSVLAPFTEQGPNTGAPGPFNFDKYAPTTAADVFADPSYQFRFDQGNRSVMANRISQGMAKTGGTLKALDRYGQNFGSQEFGAVDTRRYRDYNTNYLQARDAYDLNVVNPNQTEYSRGLTDFLNRRDSFFKSQANSFDRPYAVAQLGLGANA